MKAFDKISLKPGEIKNLEFMLDMEAFSYYDEKEKEFRVEKGAYIISVCRSAHEVWMETEVEL
ncbi:MAG: fibronectin type III-like domain-contianing protein [Lachnospiraceae bacterium]